MSDTDKLQRQYDDFLANFVHPLVRGGEVQLDRPIAPGAIAYFQHAGGSDHAIEAELYDALHRGASAIAPLSQVPWPDRDLALLAMAAYDLILLTDPELDRVFARGQRAKLLDWVDQLVDLVAPPSTRADALARHALLDPLPALRRRDVTAKSWAYTYRFIGRPLDGSVMTRPVFGHFDEDERYVSLPSLLDELTISGASAGERLRALLARSPITELLRLDLCRRFRFGLATLSVLGDSAVRGGIARAIVARGEWAAAARLGDAIGDETLATVDPAALYHALALCFEVQMTAALDTPGPGLPDRMNLNDPDTARYAAVLPAFMNDETMIDELRAFHSTDRGVLQQRSELLSAALPPGCLDQVAALVALVAPHRHTSLSAPALGATA